MPQKPKHSFKPRWQPEEIEFIRLYYGRIKTVDIIDILGRGTIRSTGEIAKVNGIQLGLRIYGKVAVEYKGQVREVNAFTYTRRNNIAKRMIPLPKVEKVKMEKAAKPVIVKTKPIILPKTKPEVKLKVDPNPFKQKAQIKPFEQPEGKVLTYIPELRLSKYL